MVPNDSHYTYDIPVDLSSLGFRGAEVPPKRSDAYRIIALGDSHVYGQGVSDEELVTTLVEHSLNNRQGGLHTRVVNMGVRAYGINQELALFEKVGLSFEPDCALLFLYVNDFADVDVENRYERFKHLDWYMFDISDKPTEGGIRKWNRIQLLRKSAFVIRDYDRYRELDSRGGFERALLNGQRIEATERRIALMRKHLERCANLSREAGFRPAIVAIPVARQISMQFPDELYQSTLRQSAYSLGVVFIDLLSDFEEFFPRTGRVAVLPYDGHYNADGHRVMADRVSKELQDVLRSYNRKLWIA